MQWIVAALVVLAQFAPASTVHAQSDHKQVLVLHSSRRDAQFSIISESELPRLLDVGLARNLDYYSEFIDISRFPQPSYRAAFREFLELKYQGVRFDLVVAIHDAALEFMNDPGTPLFRDTPVVFLTNTPGARRRANSTGVIHERKYVPTVDFLRQLQPDVRNVFIVTGAATVDEEYENAIRRQLQTFDSQLTFTYLSGLVTTALEDRLSRLPPRSAVYYVLVSEDGAGNKFHPLEYLDRVAAAANAPTYCWVDSAIDRGVVGGSLYSQTAVIERVSQLALRVLRGDAADSLPIEILDLNTNQVDWRQLRRWRIDEARVPAGTLVRFRDPTIWDRYRNYVLGALAILITQTVLIAGLLVQRKRRQRAEEDLHANQGELRRSYERNRALGARLLKAQETERSRIAGELHDDICQRMLLLTVELELLGRANRNEEAAVEALTVARDIAKSLHELSHRLHPTRLRMIGLAAAIDRLCVELSRAGIAIAYTHENVPSMLPPDVMLCLFRVVQEALQNAIKYSKAKDLSVDLRYGPDGLTVTISDDGVGFDVDAAWGKGVGLISMVERLEAIGGSLHIQSSPGSGTCVTATLPAVVLHSTDRALPITWPEPDPGAESESVAAGRAAD
jgi:signal transduction histidine kinase